VSEELCTCDQSNICSLHQTLIDAENEKRLNEEFRNETRERLNDLNDRLAAIEAMLAEYLAAQPPKKERLKHP